MKKSIIDHFDIFYFIYLYIVVWTKDEMRVYKFGFGHIWFDLVHVFVQVG